MNQNFLWICASIHYVLNNFKVSGNSVERFQKSCTDKKNRTDGLTDRLTDGRLKNIIPTATRCVGDNYMRISTKTQILFLYSLNVHSKKTQIVFNLDALTHPICIKSAKISVKLF